MAPVLIDGRVVFFRHSLVDGGAPIVHVHGFAISAALCYP